MTIKTKTSRKNKSSLKNIIPTAAIVTPPAGVAPPPAGVAPPPGNPFMPSPATAQSTPLPKNATIFQRIANFLHNNIMLVNSSQVFSGIMIIMMNL